MKLLDIPVLVIFGSRYAFFCAVNIFLYISLVLFRTGIIQIKQVQKLVQVDALDLSL